MNYWVEAIGIIGCIAYLLAFFEVSTGRWDGTSFRFEFLNILGAICIVVYSVQKNAFASIILNVIWAGIAGYGLFHCWQRYAIRKSK